MNRSLIVWIVLLAIAVESVCVGFSKEGVLTVKNALALNDWILQSLGEALEPQAFAILESEQRQHETLIQSQNTVAESSYCAFSGKVIDGATNLPLPEAHVVFWNGFKMFSTQTDKSGYYAMNLTGKGRYHVYAYQDRASNLGFDYIPAFAEVNPKSSVCELSLELIPGASIQAKGQLRFFKTLQPPTAINFTIVHRSGLRTNATSHSEGSIMGQLLNLRGTLLFVPFDTPIKVEVSIFYSSGTQFRLYIDGGADFLVLRRGELMSVDLEKQLLPFEVNSCNEYEASTQSFINQAERVGFYVRYERNELLKAKNLLDAAMSAVTKESCDEAFADLREAYFLIRRVEESLPSMYLNASVSALFITPFLSFTAMATAAVISGKRLHFLSLALLLYGFLLLLLYLFYPGYAILGAPSVVPLSLVSFVVVYSGVTGLPYAFRERTSKEGVSRISAVIMAFSIAIKNLRRRRLRTFLTLTLMLTSVFGFIALTSFSLEYGILVEHLGKARLPDGILIRKQLAEGGFAYDSIQRETYSWLEERLDLTVRAPKIENMVKEPPLGHLVSPSTWSTFEVWGIVGILPSQENKVTELNRTIIQGRFLEDGDLGGILISESAAQSLTVKIGDVLQFFNQSFTLTGIFGTTIFDRLEDPDGGPFAPYMPLVEGESITCPGERVIVMHQKTAEKQAGMVLSRVFVQTSDARYGIPLARQLILKWAGMETQVFSAGQTYLVYLGSYYLASGFVPALVPLALAALNTKILMGNIVEERKREIMVMSSLGLNPFHITALFLSEALTISILAGSLGYVMGISSYHFMTLLPFSPLVKHKVESLWAILALFSSVVTAVVGCALPAIRSSIIVTPSMVRKWRMEEKRGGLEEPWVLSMPVRLRSENLESFFSFVKNRLGTVRGHGLGCNEAIENIVEVRKGSGPASRGLSFVCYSLDHGVVSINELTSVESMIPHWYVIRLASRARHATAVIEHEFYAWKAASVIRHLVLLFATERGS